MFSTPEGLDALLNHPEARAEIDRRLQEHQVGQEEKSHEPQGSSCFLYNVIFANFPAELFNSVRLLQSILNGVSDALVPGYKALGCKVDFSDVKGSSASKKFAAYEKKYVGPAKTKAVGSGWYQK
ncbi:hypothetical protein ACKAV7_013596 [Fusarium commune]